MYRNGICVSFLKEWGERRSRDTDFMARFSKISMHGFKSFSRKTVIPLYPGFNAIIGPNGSGKSNLLDSIVFVIGSGSRALRAGRLDHVIYNGGHGKKPADLAVVTLTIDNQDGTFKDQPAEIEITRKVNRRGQSIYKLNDKTCSKADIRDILNQVGLDPDGQNIIQQGDVTNIIEMKPKQRREVIDEVAGIREYNEKKEKALKELEQAGKNLSDATLVMEEKNTYLKKLKDERDAALKVKEYEDRLGKAKAELAFTRLKAVEDTLENVARNVGIKELELQATAGKVGSFDTDLDAMQADINKLESEMLKKSANRELMKEIEELNSSIIKKESQIMSNNVQIEKTNEMILTLSQIGANKGFDIANRSVQAIVANKDLDVEGTIGNLGSVDRRFETALDVAYSGHSNDVIVTDEATAIQAIDYLKANGLGRVRLLPLDRLRPYAVSAKAEIAAKMPGIIDFAINLVRFDKKYEVAFREVLKDTLVAESVDAARKVKGLRVVTVDGELFEAGGAIVGGNLRPKKGSENKPQSIDMSRVQEYEREVKKLKTDTDALRKEVEELHDLLEEKRSKEKDENKEVHGLQEKKKALQDTLEQHKRNRKNIYEQREILGAEVQQLNLRRARLEGELENLRIDFEKYKDVQGLVKGDPEKLEIEVRKLERQLRNIGPVNMRAIEDYDSFGKEYEEFQVKVTKLAEEKASIENMIQQIEEKRKTLFADTLAQVSKEFATVFRELADGTAELSLEDPNDIESGLVIQAQPKDKKLLSIDSLSGGEKTLTALAFLFAIQRYKPSPLYILDEIDAALDARNSEKIGSLIQGYSDQSQFLLISHNDATVKKASKVYGVSMQQGSSMVMGVDLEQAAE